VLLVLHANLTRPASRGGLTGTTFFSSVGAATAGSSTAAVDTPVLDKALKRLIATAVVTASSSVRAATARSSAAAVDTPVLDEAVECLIAAAVSIWLLVRLWLAALLLPMHSLAIRLPIVLLMPLCRLLHRARYHCLSEADRALA